jgi:integrase
MYAKPAHQPKYRHFKPKNLGVVRINGRDIYLGKYNSPESLEKYGRVLAEWRATGSPPATGKAGSAAALRDAEPDALTISELILRFWKHAERHYRHADGTPTDELRNFRSSLKPLRQLYGSTPAKDFGSLKLQAVRQHMIDAGLSRGVINQRIGRIAHMFKWAAANELVPAIVHVALKTVAGLQKGRSDARETEPVKPVPDANVDTVKPFVSRQVWAMIELQRLTGMRPGEVCQMRTGDIDTSGKTWSYRPERSKMEHMGRHRVVYLGPRAQDVLKPWLRVNVTEFLFSPAEVVAEKLASRRAARKKPLTPSRERQQIKKRVRNPKRAPGPQYTVRSYHDAIKRACKRADVQHWHPHRLRHNAATYLRKEFGLDTARAVLGHGSATITGHYAELDCEKAAAAMERVG